MMGWKIPFEKIEARNQHIKNREDAQKVISYYKNFKMAKCRAKKDLDKSEKPEKYLQMVRQAELLLKEIGDWINWDTVSTDKETMIEKMENKHPEDIKDHDFNENIFVPEVDDSIDKLSHALLHSGLVTDTWILDGDSSSAYSYFEEPGEEDE